MKVRLFFFARPSPNLTAADVSGLLTFFARNRMSRSKTLWVGTARPRQSWAKSSRRGRAVPTPASRA